MLTFGLILLYLVFTLVVISGDRGKHIWALGTLVFLLVITFVLHLPTFAGVLLWGVLLLAGCILYVEPLRNRIADRLFEHAKKSVPKLSSTEEAALNAGDTWLEQDIFVGAPDWDRLSAVQTDLADEEQAFLDHEVNTLCEMLDDWEMSQTRELPEKAWKYLKENRFLGLVIPRVYGGKGFSARAHSDIVMKIATRSGAAAVTVMVPNSLGPGELLNYYGTEAQKQQYLPRLATGEDIPCFALTEPTAGSDATSIESEAVVVKRTVDGKEVLQLSVTIEKRWITLAPVATLIGLAVNLRDPSNLLQGKGEEGITCLLISRNTAGLEIGNRHLPAEQPFMNGTIRGKNLEVPIDAIIGGQENAGQGWKMLVECLSIGRSVSLPALGAGMAAISCLSASAFARIRRQFGVEIGQFEGVAEYLAEIAGLSYLTQATRLLTIAAVNAHKKPSVASAITKYFNTELARTAVNHTMDIHAGRGVVTGPRNYLFSMYQSIPVAITVEGANIMSRNLLVFGQGSMACHPWIRKEFYAVANNDKAGFRPIIWGHIHYFTRNLAKMVCSAWTGGAFLQVPRKTLADDYRTLARLSHAFAWLADLSLIILGGELKRRERLSARLADALSALYMAMGVLRFFDEHDQQPAEVAHARWALNYCFEQAREAMLGVCHNFPNRLLGRLVAWVAFPAGRRRYRNDTLDAELAQSMMSNNPYREWLCGQVWQSADHTQPLSRVESVFQEIIKQDPLVKKVPGLRKVGAVGTREYLFGLVDSGELSRQDAETLLALEKARWEAILVDEFTEASMKKKHFDSVVGDYPTPFDA